VRRPSWGGKLRAPVKTWAEPIGLSLGVTKGDSTRRDIPDLWIVGKILRIEKTKVVLHVIEWGAFFSLGVCFKKEKQPQRIKRGGERNRPKNEKLEIRKNKF